MISKYGRKFWLTVVGALVMILNAVLDSNGMKVLDTEAVMAFAGLILGYIFTEGAKDVVTAAKNPAPGVAQQYVPSDVDKEV